MIKKFLIFWGEIQKDHRFALREGEKNGGTGRTRTADRDFADLCLTTWRRCLKCESRIEERKSGAGEGIRTLDLNLGKVALYH